MPLELYDQLAVSAGVRHVSINQEIVDRLIGTFKDQYDPAPPIDEIRARLLRLEQAMFSGE
jgi:hypothetical protein